VAEDFPVIELKKPAFIAERELKAKQGLDKRRAQTEVESDAATRDMAVSCNFTEDPQPVMAPNLRSTVGEMQT